MHKPAALRADRDCRISVLAAAPRSPRAANILASMLELGPRRLLLLLLLGSDGLQFARGRMALPRFLPQLTVLCMAGHGGPWSGLTAEAVQLEDEPSRC